MDHAAVLHEGLAALKPAEPITDGRITLLPLTCTRPGRARYVLLAEAVARGRLTVTEVSDDGSVPYLKAVNQGPWPVLIFDGEELVGAKQNRIVNATVLVGVGTTILPVSCVEQGRWSARSRTFAPGEWASHPRLRREKELQVRTALVSQEEAFSGPVPAQPERAGLYRSDQGAVWREVERQSRALGVTSDTGAMADAYEDRRLDLDRVLLAFGRRPRDGGPERRGDPTRTGRAHAGGPGSEAPGGLGSKRSMPHKDLEAAPLDVPVEGMVGAAVFLDGSFLCMDALWSASRFRRLYPKLLRGYALEAMRAPGAKPAGPVDAEAATLRLFAELAAAVPEGRAGVDLGTDLRVETRTAVGAGLAYEGALVQLSVFPR